MIVYRSGNICRKKLQNILFFKIHSIEEFHLAFILTNESFMVRPEELELETMDIISGCSTEPKNVRLQLRP